MQLQTGGFIVLGDQPNHEGYRCLICRVIPDRLTVDLFVPEPEDIPPSLVVSNSKSLVLPYRLCPLCFKAKPDPWKIRLLILGRLNVLAGRCGA
jgi:hypothetical protein